MNRRIKKKHMDLFHKTMFNSAKKLGRQLGVRCTISIVRDDKK